MKEILPFATIWMNLEEIMLSEVSQTEKDIYCMVLLLRRIFFFFLICLFWLCWILLAVQAFLELW